MLKVYMLIVVFGLVGGAVYGGYYYYKDTQARIQVLTENNSKLELAAKTQTQTIDTLVQDAQKYASLNNELQSRLDSANDYKNELIGKLRKHDIAILSLQKPGLMAVLHFGKSENKQKMLMGAPSPYVLLKKEQ